MTDIRFFMSDEYDRLSRNRILMFFAAPIMLVLFQYVLGMGIQYVMIGIMMYFRHMSWDDAANHSYTWISAFGVPMAALGMIVTMLAVSSRSVIRGNGGFHFLPDDVADGDRRKKILGAFRSLLSGAFIGMCMWMVLTILVNALYAIGIDVSGSSSTTKSVTQSMMGAVGLSTSHGFTVTSGIITLAFSAVLSPLVEEMFFRGFLGRSIVESPLMRRKDHSRSVPATIMVCVLSGLWFGLGHINTADSMKKVIFTALWMLFMGTLYTWLATMRQGGLLLTVSAHVTYNVITLVSVFMFPSQLGVMMMPFIALH
jgi:membrane protease YdiL (CAAX protease family)